MKAGQSSAGRTPPPPITFWCEIFLRRHSIGFSLSRSLWTIFETLAEIFSQPDRDALKRKVLRRDPARAHDFIAQPKVVRERIVPPCGCHLQLKAALRAWIANRFKLASAAALQRGVDAGPCRRGLLMKSAPSSRAISEARVISAGLQFRSLQNGLERDRLLVRSHGRANSLSRTACSVTADQCLQG